MLIDILILIVVAIVAYWVITKFFPAPIQTVALVVAGIGLLIWLFVITGLFAHIPARLLN